MVYSLTTPAITPAWALLLVEDDEVEDVAARAPEDVSDEAACAADESVDNAPRSQVEDSPLFDVVLNPVSSDPAEVNEVVESLDSWAEVLDEVNFGASDVVAASVGSAVVFAVKVVLVAAAAAVVSPTVVAAATG